MKLTCGYLFQGHGLQFARVIDAAEVRAWFKAAALLSDPAARTMALIDDLPGQSSPVIENELVPMSAGVAVVFLDTRTARIFSGAL